MTKSLIPQGTSTPPQTEVMDLPTSKTYTPDEYLSDKDCRAVLNDPVWKALKTMEARLKGEGPPKFEMPLRNGKSNWQNDTP